MSWGGPFVNRRLIAASEAVVLFALLADMALLRVVPRTGTERVERLGRWEDRAAPGVEGVMRRKTQRARVINLTSMIYCDHQLAVCNSAEQSSPARRRRHLPSPGLVTYEAHHVIDVCPSRVIHIPLSTSSTEALDYEYPAFGIVSLKHESILVWLTALLLKMFMSRPTTQMASMPLQPCMTGHRRRKHDCSSFSLASIR